MKGFVVSLAAFLAAVLATGASAGELDVRIDPSDEQMQLAINQQAEHVWPVSTARPGPISGRTAQIRHLSRR